MIGDRDEARAGVDHARREPRPAEDLQQEDGRRAERRGRRASISRSSSPTWAPPRPRRSTSASPRSSRASPRSRATVPPADWRTYLRWHAARTAAPLLSKAFQDEDFAFNGKKLNGTPQQEEPWRRVQAATDCALGEAVGPIYVARAFSPQREGAHEGPRREHARRPQGAHRGAPVDERRDEGRRPSGSSPRSASRSATRTSGGTTRLS